MTERRIAGARDGDVIFAHINQPGYAAGQGVAEGSVALRKPGFEFVLLKDAAGRLTSRFIRQSSTSGHTSSFTRAVPLRGMTMHVSRSPRFTQGYRPGHETVPR
jgi:hypothetical protein